MCGRKEVDGCPQGALPAKPLPHGVRAGLPLLPWLLGPVAFPDPARDPARTTGAGVSFPKAEALPFQASPLPARETLEREPAWMLANQPGNLGRPTWEAAETGRCWESEKQSGEQVRGISETMQMRSAQHTSRPSGRDSGLG